MTNKEAVNWLINIMADIGKAEHSELWHYEQALMGIREMLEAEPQWIPCSERLPEEYGNYLVTTDDGDVDIGTIDTDTYSKRWSACDANGFFWLRKVIAWMPLPEPYKGDTE